MPGGVVVRDDHVRSDERTCYDVRIKADHRGHRARGIGDLHELAARPHEAHRVRETKRARSHERAEFAERVAEDDNRLGKGRACDFLRRAKCGDRRRDQSGLGIRGLIELVLGTVEAQRSQVDADRLVRLFEDTSRAWIALGEIFSHPDHLRSLSGKEPRIAPR